MACVGVHLGEHGGCPEQEAKQPYLALVLLSAQSALPRARSPLVVTNTHLLLVQLPQDRGSGLLAHIRLQKLLSPLLDLQSGVKEPQIVP